MCQIWRVGLSTKANLVIVKRSVLLPDIHLGPYSKTVLKLSIKSYSSTCLVKQMIKHDLKLYLKAILKSHSNKYDTSMTNRKEYSGRYIYKEIDDFWHNEITNKKERYIVIIFITINYYSD